jgi:hypothetical protein
VDAAPQILVVEHLAELVGDTGPAIAQDGPRTPLDIVVGIKTTVPQNDPRTASFGVQRPRHQPAGGLPSVGVVQLMVNRSPSTTSITSQAISPEKLAAGRVESGS